MKLTITQKLIFSFLGLTLLVLIATLTLARWSFEKGFLDYMNALEQTRLELIRDDLAEVYLSENENWGSLTQQNFDLLVRQSLRRSHRDNLNRLNSGRPPDPPKHGRKFGPPTALFDNDNNKIVGTELNRYDDEQIRVPIIANGAVVGELRSEPRRLINTPLETAFSKQQLNTSWIIGIVCLILAAIVSMLLARGLLAPILRMVGNVEILSSGNYAVRLNEERKDELGELMDNLDHLALKLEESQSSRRRWLAEISHELRTPLTVLNGEIEALKDGLREFNSEQLNSLDQEVKRLKYLIDDLYDLSLSDIGGLRYEFSSCNLHDCLKTVVNEYRKRESKHEVELVSDGSAVWINADVNRVDQLFKNLFENSLAYTAVPGRIEVKLSQSSGRVTIEINDTPPGVSETDCEHLFDPLFRLESSRSRKTGGAGLGLSICKNIVKAHNGKITAIPSDMGGLCVRIQFPVAREAGS